MVYVLLVVYFMVLFVMNWVSMIGTYRGFGILRVLLGGREIGFTHSICNRHTRSVGRSRDSREAARGKI